MFRKLLWWLFAFLLVLLALWIFRYPLLRATGNVLMRYDDLRHADAIYVLGGSSLDRGMAASELLKEGWAPIAYCTSENIPHSFIGEGLFINEARLTANVMLRNGTDSSQVIVLPVATSTWEESIAILDHAMNAGMDTVIVVSTDFHTRRVGTVFRERFKKNGITVIIRGAPSSQYDHQRWWEQEEGLLMVNNEYVKLVYYLLKY